MTIGVTVLLTVLPMLETFGRAETAKRLNRDADILLELLNQYYVKHCGASVFPTVTESALRREGFLIAGGFNNPWGDPFQLTINRTNPRNPLLQVSLVFRRTVDAGFVLGFAKNAALGGATLTWTEQSTLSRTLDGFARQRDREVFGSAIC